MDRMAPAEHWRLQLQAAFKVFHYYSSHAEQDLMFGILHPGGGQNYCLSILDAQNVLVFMNRDASATTQAPKQHRVPDFASKAVASPEKLAISLFGGSGLPYSYESVSVHRAAKLRMIGHIIGFLGELAGQEPDLAWGFFDSASEGSFSNYNDFPANFPAHWKEAAPVNTQFYDWSANVLQITAKGEIVATYNQQTAEVLFDSGKLLKF